jgi:hypothetical protein
VGTKLEFTRASSLELWYIYEMLLNMTEIIEFCVMLVNYISNLLQNNRVFGTCMKKKLNWLKYD